MYRLTIATMLVLAIAVGGYTQTSRLTTNSSSPSYGKEQTDRGKAPLFTILQQLSPGEPER